MFKPNYHTVALISRSSKLMLKILQARLQQYVNCDLPDVQGGFRKYRGTRDQIVNIRWIIKKCKRFPEKYVFLLYWLCQSLWLCGSQQALENSSRDGNTRPPDWPTSWEICMQVRKQQLELELDMEQQTGSKSGKAIYRDLAYLTSMQSTSCEMLGWMKHKLESRLTVEISISITSDMQITPP